jgi:hypothetical protein
VSTQQLLLNVKVHQSINQSINSIRDVAPKLPVPVASRNDRRRIYRSDVTPRNEGKRSEE